MRSPVRNFLGKLGLMLVFTCGSAQAQPVWEARGVAAYTETSRDIYVAALLMPAGDKTRNLVTAPGPRAMEYRIARRRLSTRGFSSMLLLQAEMGSGARAPRAVKDAFNELLSNLKGPLLKGDHFVIKLSAANATIFYLNDTTLLSVDGRSVFDFFFAGWVGESSSALLRDSLLAGTLEPALLARYEALRPNPVRIAAIAAWMLPRDAIAETPAVAEKTSNLEQAEPGPVAATEPEPNTGATEPEHATPLPHTPAAEIKQNKIEYRRQLDRYISHVMKMVFGNVDYPRRAITRQRQGEVELMARLGKSGELLEVALDNSSGYSALDDAARRAVRRAAPFPDLPPRVLDELAANDSESYVVMIPVTFKLLN